MIEDVLGERWQFVDRYTRFYKEVLKSYVHGEEDAYPIYDLTYQEHE